MKITFRPQRALLVVAALGFLTATWICRGQSLFTYQGRLSAAGDWAGGSYDFRFCLFDAASGGSPVGAAVSNSLVVVADGFFGASLDFGAGVFDGSQRWLEIGVRTNCDTGEYVLLSPRQALTAAPYAIYASTAGVAGVATNLAGGGAWLTNIHGTNIQAGTVTSNQIDAATDAAYRRLGEALTNIHGSIIQAGTITSNQIDAATDTAYRQSGEPITNLHGSNIQAGTITSNQIDVATDAAYRLGNSALTNGYVMPVSLGNPNGAHFYCEVCYTTNTLAPTATNIVIGMDLHDWSKTGGSILFPDRGGIFWYDGSYIYGWNDHSAEGGISRNELQIGGNSRIAFTCYNAAACNGGFQMGGSGDYHDKFWFQYDTAYSNPGRGFSKLIEFVTRSGVENAYAYSGIRAVAADTTSGMNTLNFYSGNPSAIDNSGGNRVGTMLTNGWDFRGRIVTEHATYFCTVSNVIDWLKPSSSEFRVQGDDDMVFSTANLPSGTTNNETRVVLIKAGSYSPHLSFPAGWHWFSESGNGTAPTVLAAGRILKLTLTALGPDDTEVLAEAKVALYP